MIIHHDQDAVFTGYGWTGQLLLKDGVRLSYALRGAQDNPEMEACISRFSVQDPEIVGSGKEENRSLFLDAQTLDELCAVVRDRMVYHNNERRHSRIEYLAPLRYVEMLQSGPWSSQIRGGNSVQLLGYTPQNPHDHNYDSQSFTT